MGFKMKFIYSMMCNKKGMGVILNVDYFLIFYIYRIGSLEF